MKASPRRPSRVQTLERAFGLLESVAAARSARLPDLVASSELPHATVHRLTRSMTTLGYLRYDASGRFRLGPRALWLAARAPSQIEVAANRHLRALVEATGETACLAALDGDDAVFLVAAPSSRYMRVDYEIGSSVPAHRTAIGKALLAHLPDRELRARVSCAELLTELACVRRRGYAVDVGENEPGVTSLAAPIRGRSHAVAVSGPDTRMTRIPRKYLAAEVGKTASAIAAEVADADPTRRRAAGRKESSDG